MSQKRLQIEIQDFSNNPPENYEEGPMNENDLYKWIYFNASIRINI